MSCTNPTVLRRRRIIAAALALPLSLGMVSTAYATGPADEPRGSAETASLRVASADKELPAKAAAAQAETAEKADLRVADAGPAEKANEKATEKKAESKPEAPAEKAAEKKADKPAVPGAAAGAASGKSAAAATTTSTTGSYANGNKNSSKDERPTAPVPGTPSQPLSNADKNGTGANPGDSCTHAYCSNGTGLESGNGKGDGNANGKPCAGCVGKADNKNPKGQAPNGSDHNAGYECDRNQGIGKTNPAHTGCSGTATTPPTTPPKVKTCPNGDPMPASGKVKDCEKDDKVKTCPNGDPMPASGKVKDCEKDDKVKTCPNGDPMPASGKVKDCEKDDRDKDKITFCHATGSSTNPYVVIETSKAAAANGHHGVDHQGGRDIIPAFTYKGVSYPAQGNQALFGTGCVQGGTTVDVCPDMTGNQPVGTNCGGGGGDFDQCPNIDGMQPAGTTCTIGGGGGGGGSSDNCPDMPGNQPANTVCTVGSPNPPGKPISGKPLPQPATNPVPVGPPTQVIVPNTAVPPAVIGGTKPLAVNRPISARAVPSALPFTGGEAAMLVQLGLLLVAAGVGVGAVARRERTAV